MDGIQSIYGMTALAVLIVFGLALVMPGLMRLCRWLAGPAVRPEDPDPCCAHCGYSVRKLPDFICPECGHDLRKVGVIRPSRTASEGNYPPVLTAMGVVLIILAVVSVIRNYAV